MFYLNNIVRIISFLIIYKDSNGYKKKTNAKKTGMFIQIFSD